MQRWIVAALRNRTFFSLGELNAAIRELVDKLNARPFKKLDGCRRSAFESSDKPAMRPLPVHRYAIAKWKRAMVNIDYCVTLEDRQYSVPYALVGAAVEIRATASVIEILHKGIRVASHPRHYGPKGAATIAEEHRPRAHREYGKWPPERVVTWAASVGEHVGAIARAITSRKVTNAAAESLNAKIQALKRSACGFRKRARFRNAILFHCGGLELYPATGFHTGA